MTRTIGAFAAAAVTLAMLPTCLIAIGLWLVAASARRAYRYGFVAGFWNATLSDLLDPKLPEGK